MKRMVASSFVAIAATAEGGVATFSFAPDLPVFAGHFPGTPLVPGVFVIEAVRCAVERLLGRACLIRVIDDARWSSPIAPGVVVTIEIALSEVPEGLRCQAVARTPAAVAAKVRLVLTPAPRA